MTESMQMQNTAIMTAGMKLLREKLGLIECEIFISNIKQNNFDYTKWRENLYEDMSLEELVSKAAEFERQNPELIPKNAKII